MNTDQIVNELEKVSDFGINLLNSARENGVSVKEKFSDNNQHYFHGFAWYATYFKAIETTYYWIKDLAKKTENKSFKPSLIKKMNDEEAIEYLSELRQIGRWSAEMILLFTFNRSNIWPLQDIGLLRAISNNYNKKYFPPKSFLDKLYKKFSPYCSVATLYLWRSIDNEPIQY